MEDSSEIRRYTPDEIYYVSCELSHDLYAGLHERVRWNNRSMAMAIRTINELQQELDGIKKRQTPNE